MPRVKKRNPMNLPISSNVQGEEEGWKPRGPCKFQQLERALVMDILSRLSIETLFNCRCVCKSWLSVISDPQFSHLQFSRLPIAILIKTYPPKSKSRRLDLTQIEECASSHFWLQKSRFTPKNSLPSSEFEVINSCNGLLLLTGPESADPLYVCNPILGEYITITTANKRRPLLSFVGLVFSVGTNEYKVLHTFHPLDSSQNKEAEIYTIGTGIWRSLGNAPSHLVDIPFNAFLHGAFHWVCCGGSSSEFIHSFNFEREQFLPLPPPSYFGPKEKDYAHCLKLGVLGGCLLLCVFGDDSREFNMWVMKDYGVQESWTKTLVIENLYPRELWCDFYEPMVFLRNGEIIMLYNNCALVCYNQETMSFRETKITRTRSEFCAIAYSPCFVSLYNVAKVEEVKRVRGSKKSEKLYAEGSYDCASSGMPPHKTTKHNSGYGWPSIEEGLPSS